MENENSMNFHKISSRKLIFVFRSKSQTFKKKLWKNDLTVTIFHPITIQIMIDLKKTLIIFILLFQLVHSECYLQQNSFLDITQDSSSTIMKVGICGSEGWSAIAFSKTTSIKDMTFGAITFKSNNTKPVYSLSSHLILKEQIPFIPHTSEKTFHYWRMNSFTLRLNYTFDWNYVIFACKKSSQNFFGIPLESYETSYNSINQSFVFSTHNKANIIKKSETQQCYTYGYKVTDFTISKEFTFLWFLNIFMLVILLILGVSFRHREPLSTKGIIPFLALGLFILESVNGLLYVVSTTFEFVYHYGCFFSGVFYTPARMTLIVLFFIVNFQKKNFF